MKCGSGWVCPACMMYIQERRRQELTLALERSKDDYFSVLATYTFRHNIGMRLPTMLRQMQESFKAVKSGRMWQLIKSEYMLVGSVKALEITYGANGWHPHIHELILVKRKMIEEYNQNSTDEFALSLYHQMSSRWTEALANVGLSGLDGVAFDLRSSKEDVAEYVSKWGKLPSGVNLNVKADEVAYSVSKTPADGSLGVLDILYMAEHSEKHANLYREYHAATKGRSQLQWSRGLKALLDIEIVRDEIAAQGIETETDRILAEVRIDLWKYISTHGYMGQVMTYAHDGNDTKLGWLLDTLNDKCLDDWQPVPGSEWQLGH